jgi:aminoglycoside phosphotransferase (APT) family kinase protein
VSERDTGDLDTITPELLRWIESTLHGRVTRCERASAGGSRITFLADVAVDDGVLPVVVRVDAGAFAGTELSLRREAVAYRALGPTEVPVPVVLAEHDDGTSLILERLPGTHDLEALPEHERAAVMSHLVDVLAALHRLDPDGLDLPGFERPATAEDHARLDIDRWLRIAADVAHLDPLLAYAGAWLLRHAPARASRTSFLQGDTGPGNLLALDGRVTGLVDFELAHVGDPMDDLAWLLMRTGATAAQAADLLAGYERRSGIPVDHAAVGYYRIAVDLRCAITTSLAVERGGGARGFAPYLLATQRFLDGLARRLAEATGSQAPAPPAPSPATARDALFGALLDDVRRAARALDDGCLRERTRDAQILVHHLRAWDRNGALVEREDRADRHGTFGSDLDDDALARAAGAAGAAEDRGVLAYLLRRQQRHDLLWHPLLERGR